MEIREKSENRLVSCLFFTHHSAEHFRAGAATWQKDQRIWSIPFSLSQSPTIHRPRVRKGHFHSPLLERGVNFPVG